MRQWPFLLTKSSYKRAPSPLNTPCSLGTDTVQNSVGWLTVKEGSGMKCSYQFSMKAFCPAAIAFESWLTEVYQCQKQLNRKFFVDLHITTLTSATNTEITTYFHCLEWINRKRSVTVWNMCSGKFCFHHIPEYNRPGISTGMQYVSHMIHT